MTDDKSTLDVGGSISTHAIVAALAALLALVLGYSIYRNLSTETVFGEIVIATGPESGTYHALGQALQRELEHSGQFKAVSLRPTDGSFENMRLLESGSEIDLAFVQADASPSRHARLITALHDEVLHVLIRTELSDSIRTIYDLDGKRISLGALGSGTRELARTVIEHLGIEPAEDRIASPTQAVEALRRDEVDAIFILAALPSRLVGGLADEGAIRFLSIGDHANVGDESAALELVIPGVERLVIPRATYRRLPTQPISTISVPGLLVAREELDEEMVRYITGSIFGYRAGETAPDGRKLAVARQIRENYDPASSTIAYHPGAIAYYNRERPPFIVEYAEALSLGITLLLGMYSVFVALRELLRRRMKNRVDAYLVQIEQLVANRDQLDLQGLEQLWMALDSLRHTAIVDLVEERLLADDAYHIMQNHIDQELTLIRLRKEQISRTNLPPSAA